MASQLQSVSSTGEEEDAFTMVFSFDVESDVQNKVEHMAYKSTLGKFKAAREISDSISKEQANIFPIAFEILRLLYDQGQYVQLRKTIQQFKNPRPSSSSTTSQTHRGWSEQESEIFELMDTLAIASMEAISTSKLLDRRPMVAVERRLRALRPNDLDDEHVISSVILLRLRYLDHEVVWKLPSKSFEVLFGEFPPELVSRFLEAEYFWAAENILEVCFRRGKGRHQRPDLKSIWACVVRFLDAPGRKPGDARIWAQIGILQTFCEGCLRRGLVDDKVELTELSSWSWDHGMKTLSELILVVQAEQEESSWTDSRASIRQELLMLDYQIWLQVQDDTLTLEKDTIIKLIDLAGLARENDDVRYQAGIRWRLEKLLSTERSQILPTPYGSIAVPSSIYATRQMKVQGLTYGEAQTLRETAEDIKKLSKWSEAIKADKQLAMIRFGHKEQTGRVKDQEQWRDRESGVQNWKIFRNKRNQDAEQMQMNIDAVEEQAWLIPRIIVHNRSGIPLHLRLFNPVSPNSTLAYENDVGARELRALRWVGGDYQLEAFLSVPGNQLPGKKDSSISAASYLFGRFSLSQRRRSRTASSLSRRLGKRNMEENFNSEIADGEEDSIRISSSVPMQDLTQEVYRQMLAMEMTRKGERFSLFRSDVSHMGRYTRLEISGGPHCIKHESYVRYDFDTKAKPLHAEKVDKFTADT